MDLSHYRASSAERERAGSLLSLIPAAGKLALDIGARDGHFSLLLAERFDRVIALDLTLPRISHPRVECVAGNAAALPYEDNAIDLVFCAEVLEHIPPPLLSRVCGELERVCRGTLVIGVPYKQDLRFGRTTCYTCRQTNPPWGHVNSFDEQRLAQLFPLCSVRTVAFAGQTTERTNALSAWLMDRAGNPYGTYVQEEPCVHCGSKLLPPPERSIAQKVLTRLAFWTRRFSDSSRPRGNWIHMAFSKAGAPPPQNREAMAHSTNGQIPGVLQ
ncbi:class I SAM-dependent methyltransferase [Noviherbaspirillum denitrificans]|uniref:Methyltransferase type 11 domain-containing protein n=1 Tax=Noviherbaspirillum denitrificans TaxID=1968433 RepID=A0A254TII0_9BURK|nr:class I SAM-dependent methyltransferase [Noviherbaspirillum denitrificans]OWW22439.1 hypothetical protein AYR66_26025 [Noviherbaspirillum denitrificans]